MCIYTSLYGGQFNGDTWTLPDSSKLNPRARAVEETAAQFDGPIDLLDIGCGKGKNTIGILKSGGTWTGVDVASAEHLSLNLPAGAKFSQGSFRSEEFRKELGSFDMIVDQGAVMVEIDDRKEMEEYVTNIYSMLNSGGRFVALLFSQFQGENGSSIIFPDGRKRALWLPDQIAAFFNEHFEVESGLEYENAYSYLPGENNPLGAKIGDSRQVTLFHMVFRKK